MADISKIKTPDNTELTLKDAFARSSIENLIDNQYASSSNFPVSGEVGKIYIAKDTNEVFRWDLTSSQYISIYSDFIGATTLASGVRGLVPAPNIADSSKFLKGNGTWDNVDALPAVTSSDNGKFLCVVNGAWAATTMQVWQGGSY